jgi:ligand-binding sensor domain-containing protein/signal transduction histidine kinase
MKMVHWIFSAILFFVINSSAQNYHFEHYNIHNGLGQSQVSDLVQDQFGYIWMATRGGGLSRFDGLHFKTFRREDGLPANNISSLKIDSKKHLLIGSNRGFTVYDGRRFQYISRKKPVFLRNIFVNKSNEVFAVFEKNGIGFFKNDSLIVLKPNNSKDSTYFESVNYDSKGNLFLASPQGILCSFIDSKIQKVLQVPKGIMIRNFLITKAGKIWISTNKGVFIINKIQEKILKKDLQKVSDFFANSMIETQRGEIWLGLFQGAIRFDNNLQETYFSEENGFTNASINKVFEDRDGILWFATDGDGAFKFTNSPFTYLNIKNGLADNTAFGILPDQKNRIWIGSFTKGLSVWDGKKVSKIVNSNSGLKRNGISSVFLDSKGNKWFGVGVNTVTKIDLNDKISNYSIESKECTSTILSISEGENGEIWLGTFCGVYLLKDGKFKHFSDKDGLLSIRTPEIVKIAANTFVVFSIEGANIIKDYKVYPFKEAGSWQNSRVVSTVFHPKWNMLFWGDMEEGISAYNFNNKQKYHFSTKNGLTSNLIYNLIFDKNDQLWVGSEKGIERIKFTKDWKIEDIKYYSQNEGMKGIETNEASMVFDAGGNLWIGTIMGAYRYYPERDKADTKPLKVQLTEVKLLIDTTKIAQFATKTDQWDDIYDGLELPHQHNNLLFRYITISHRNPQETVYQYKLEGFDTNWSMPITKTEIAYTNLPAGEFTLLLRASNNCGEWTGELTKYSFRIKPPFWQTWWFGLLSVSVILGGIFASQKAYSNYQTRKVLAFEKLKQVAESDIRKQIAQDFHDELGNRLAAITTQSSVLKMKIDKNSENRQIVKEIEENARKLYTDTKDFIWTIDPESNRLNELVIYIKDFGEKLYQFSGIEFIVKNEISDEFQDVVLPAGWSIQLIMVFKEAMTNALKHAQAKHVYFEFEFDDKSFKFSIKDDGIGIKLAENGSANKGIKNMLIRAEKINSQLSIKQIQPNGTMICLEGVIPKK